MNDLSKLSNEELEELLLSETDPSAVNNIINIFNLNIKKKDVVRANALSDLQDKISGQMQQRISNKADEFSNKDLLDYFKTVQEFIDKSGEISDSAKVPTIQINQQNNLGVNLPNPLPKDSRDKVIDVVQSILKNYTFNNVEEVEVVNDDNALERSENNGLG